MNPKIDNMHLSRNIENVNDCVIAIMTAEKYLSEHIKKMSDDEDVNTFVFDGLCKTVSIATESIGRSVDDMRKILN